MVHHDLINRFFVGICFNNLRHQNLLVIIHAKYAEYVLLEHFAQFSKFLYVVMRNFILHKSEYLNGKYAFTLCMEVFAWKIMLIL